MTEAVIIDAVRTPVARGDPEKGLFRHIRADDLGTLVVRALMERKGIDPASIEDVIFGCANQTAEQFSPGRHIALLAGLPFSVAGFSVERQCASSMSAVHVAAQAIISGCGDIFIAGGIESMSHIAMGTGIDPNPKFAQLVHPSSAIMGLTAENLVELYKVPREEQDRWALLSNQRAVAAQKEGRFKAEMVPVEITLEDGTKRGIDFDQDPRPDTTLEKIASLKPSFKPNGTVNPANASGISDGASAILIMSKDKAWELGLKPMVTIRSMAVAGVDPKIMGIGPVPASQKALKRAGLTIDDMDLIEINEAFAAVVLVCMKELGIKDPDKVNVNGGACAIGHPLGMSGARIITTLAHEMVRRGGHYGLATMCVGMGQGAAAILERENYPWVGS